MHRFYLPAKECAGTDILLSGREAHHALHVLRVSRGEQVTVLGGSGQRLLCTVEDCTRDRLHLRVLEREQVPPPPFEITLLQAIPKGSLMDSIVQKATELGVTRVVPLVTERVISRFNQQEGEHKAEKWRQTAVEAIKQSGSSWLTHVDAPVSPEDFIRRGEPMEMAFVASLQEHSRHPREYFMLFAKERGGRPVKVCVWVGPEGDFTPEEMQLIIDSGAKPITLGPRVLRSETAAIYCLSFVNYELTASERLTERGRTATERI